MYDSTSTIAVSSEAYSWWPDDGHQLEMDDGVASVSWERVVRIPHCEEPQGFPSRETTRRAQPGVERPVSPVAGVDKKDWGNDAAEPAQQNTHEESNDRAPKFKELGPDHQAAPWYQRPREPSEPASESTLGGTPGGAGAAQEGD